MARDAARFVVMLVSIVAVALAGCAKRPGVAQSSAPPPTGSAIAMAPADEPPRTVVAASEPAVASQADALAPAAARVDQRPSPKGFEATPDLRPIYFDFDRADIRPSDMAILDAYARWLVTNSRRLLMIQGHADERGTAEYNLALGERRAQSTRSYLLSRGVQAQRMTVISYGEEWPVCTEHNEACWSRNRRAQFLLRPAE